MKMDTIVGRPAMSAPTYGKKDLRILQTCIAAILACQAFLIFAKGFNWDEFLHFSQVHDLREGRLFWLLQTFHARLFYWVPDVADAVVDQMRTVRVAMLAFEIVAIAAIVKIARQFTDRVTALFAGLVYVASGVVFVHGFSFRADPMITALLMVSLAIIVTSRLSLGKLLLAGALVGLAGVISVKSIIYLPCFIGAAFYRISDDGRLDLKIGMRLLVVPVAALAVLAVLLAWHQTGVLETDAATSAAGSRATRFLGSGLFLRWTYTAGAFLSAPVLTAGLVVSCALLRGRTWKEVLLFASFALPLASIVFYRNTYPYFFVFLFAPLALAAIPAYSAILGRYGVAKVVPVVLASPLLFLVTQPYWLLANQRAQIEEIHRLFPQPVEYLSYSSYVPDYPRIIPNLISGLGLAKYNAAGIPVIAEHIHAGKVGFVLADNAIVHEALHGRKVANSLTDEDFEAIDGNFLHYTNAIWLSGKQVCPSSGPQEVTIVRPGPYTLDGGNLSVDGASRSDRTSITMAAGPHSIRNSGEKCVRLWNLPEVPAVPSGYPDGPSMAGF